MRHRGLVDHVFVALFSGAVLAARKQTIWCAFVAIKGIGRFLQVAPTAGLGDWNVDAHGLPDDAPLFVDAARAGLAVGAQLAGVNLW